MVAFANEGSARGFKTRVAWYVTAIAAQKAKWDRLFSLTYDLSAAGYHAGDEAIDIFTGAHLVVGAVSNVLGWTAPGLVVKTANGAVVKNSLVTFGAATTCETAGTGAQGAVFHGVAMNDAADTEAVYVYTLGTYNVLTGSNAVTVGLPVSVGTAGNAGKTDPNATGDAYMGYKMASAVSIGGVSFTRCTFSSTIIISA